MKTIRSLDEFEFLARLPQREFVSRLNCFVGLVDEVAFSKDTFVYLGLKFVGFLEWQVDCYGTLT